MNRPSIGFKQSTQQFLAEWKSDRLIRQIGRLVAWLIVLIALLYILFYSVSNLIRTTQFSDVLLNGSFGSRLFWLFCLILLPSIYLLDEIKRRLDSTSKDDVFHYLDQGTRSILVEGLRQSFKRGQKLTIDFLLLEFSLSSYFLNLLNRLEVRSQSLLSDLSNNIDHKQSGLNSNAPELDDDLRTLLIKSAERAMMRGDFSFGVADIFLSMLESSSSISSYFNKLDIVPEKFAVVISWLSAQDHIKRDYQKLREARIHTGERNQAWTSAPTPVLNQYGHDLTISASYGLAPFVSVRKSEIETLVGVLSRATKNSALLIGEPGVGKSSIVNRIALKMFTQDVPEPMKDKRLIQLDLAAMHADQHGFAATFEQAVSEGEKAGNCIIYIPNLSDLASEVSGGVSSSELLLPILDRGRMQIVGAASEKEYRELIEPIAEFNDYFDIVRVDEVNKVNAMKIMEEIGIHLEYQHHIEISLKAMESAVDLSDQYIHDKVLPEKAIDVLDQAATEASAAGKTIVEKADIEAVISKDTSIPIGNISQSEGQILLNLSEILHTRVVGQNEAVDAVASAMQRARAETEKRQRPIGAFLFVGPTGVGKTELAKALSDSYFGNSKNMVRLDMSEYSNADSTERLLGTDRTVGLLTEPVRTKPFTLLLLDEFEKSAKEVRNLFLQVFDDGHLTDGAGHLVDFKNSIIIATSNAGSVEIQQKVADNNSYDDIKEFLINEVLPSIFSPELLNRFDSVIVFRPLNRDDILQIAKINIKAELEPKYLVTTVESYLKDQ